ncbi:hypothetical protein BHE74_00016912 [Ensete ventricosum]|nr:hypothetical protein BHE74_00016912 [Ensete ventricosum]
MVINRSTIDMTYFGTAPWRQLSNVEAPARNPELMCEASSAHPLRHLNNQNLYKVASRVGRRPYEKYKSVPSEKPKATSHNIDPRGSINARPCALARPWSSRYEVGAQPDGWYLRVRLGKSDAGMVELESGGTYIVGVVDHPYLTTWLPLWLTMSSYTSTTPAVLAPGKWSGVGANPTEQELENLNVARADPTEQEFGNWDGTRADLTEYGLGNSNVARADSTEQELGNWDSARVDLIEHGLGNWNGTRADLTEQVLGNLNVTRADPTEQELGNWDGTRADLTEYGLGNWNGTRADLTEQELFELRLLPRVNSGANLGTWPRG